VRIESEDSCLVYSSDTAPCKSIVELSRKRRVLVHEASGHDPLAHLHGDSAIDDALSIAERAGVKSS
jgi:ribonuclease Z